MRRQRQICVRDRSTTSSSAARSAFSSVLGGQEWLLGGFNGRTGMRLPLIHISEPKRHLRISYAVFCLKKKSNAIRKATTSEARCSVHNLELQPTLNKSHAYLYQHNIE